MRALVSAPLPTRIDLADVPDPQPQRDEAIVAVHAVSLNRGEIKRLEAAAPGTQTGWDVAGVVQQAAADGSGPPAGARVVGLTFTGWAQLAPVSTAVLAQLPDGISFEQASTLPVAGLTALRALEKAGFVLGKRVLVTGASGGVGRFAIQLAKLAGAHVTALSRRTAGLAELGADDLISELEPSGERFDVVIDAVGGPVLGAALARVAPRGIVINFASTVPEPVSYATRDFFSGAAGASLYGLLIFPELLHTRTGVSDLRRLAGLVAEGKLDPQIALTLPWTQAREACEELLERRVDGKAVLTVE
jgi:NADPH:quinone reductase